MSVFNKKLEGRVGLSKLCPDCREKFDAKHFRIQLQHPLVARSGRKSDPLSHTLIHEYVYQKDMPSTGQSRDCDLCRLVIDIIANKEDTDGPGWEEQWERKWTSGRWLARCRSTDARFLDVEELVIQLFDEKYGSLGEDFIIGHEFVELDVRVEPGNPAERYISTLEFDSNHGSSGNLILGNTWVNDCLQTHERCGSHLPDPLLPTRVVDIGESNDQVHLLETNGGIDKYIALSYCWGKKNLQRTTQDVLAENLRCIKWVTLSSTIKDAITLARTYNIRYLWIDALCIIQDNQEDKSRELANMTNIYENATLTIIAACAGGADEGFLQAKPTPKIDLRVPYGDDDGTLFLRTERNIEAIDAVNDPTETRAWCLQESLLSRKCLVFSSLYMYWSCQEVRYANQDMHISNNLGHFRDTIRHFIHNPPAILHAEHKVNEISKEDREELCRFWREVSSEYSHRKISFLGDRLPAISAVAGRMHEISRDKYYAGLWDSDFSRQLFWKKGTSETMRERQTASVQPRPEEYIAPTWSWLSCQGRIVYPTFHVDPNLKVLDIHVELADLSQPFGAVNGGYVKLTGRLEQVSVLGPHPTGFHWLGKKHRLPSEICHRLGEGKGDVKGYPDAKDEMVIGVDGIWCLQGGMDISSKCIGLILKQDGSKEQFRRIGSFVYKYKDAGWFQDSEFRTISIV